MDEALKKQLSMTANAIRQLSIEAVQEANSGHPGMPMGCAEIGAYLFGVALKNNPKNPDWLNRDRFVLSAGHGSTFLYSCLHLSGYDLSIEDIKSFRKLHSKTPGHPEYGHTKGVEATTGPLGQGFGNAVGIALAMKILQAKFNTDAIKLIDNKIYTLAGDGCMMEGVSSEVSSLAAHLGLDNLVVIYDANDICLDGPLNECMSENTKERYKSYGWDVFEIDGHDFDAIEEVISSIKEKQEKPVLIIAHTIIGKGSPNKAGTSKIHGSPLGEEEVIATKKALNLSDEKFFVPKEVKEYFQARLKKMEEKEKQWNEKKDGWEKANPHLYKEFLQMQKKQLPKDIETILEKIEVKRNIASRESSGVVVNEISKFLPFLYGGSADLSASDKTYLNQYRAISSHDFRGRNIKYGVREFAMGTIANGLYLSNMIVPFCGTFLVFCDYLRGAIRLASLSSYHVIYQFTHDSIFVGEDGPTHQPIEQLASLRSIPNLHVIRPSDSNEVKMAWLAALYYQGPTALILSRQSLMDLIETKIPYSEGMAKGAYIIKKEKKKADYNLFASGSEVLLALKVAEELEQHGKDVRVVSFPCWELFEKQNKEYKDSIINNNGVYVSIEAGVDQGWHKYIGKDGIAISINSFGLSAPAKDVAEELGFTKEKVLQCILGR